MSVNRFHPVKDGRCYQVRGQKLREAACLTPCHSVKSHLSVPASLSCHVWNPHVITTAQRVEPTCDHNFPKPEDLTGGYRPQRPLLHSNPQKGREERKKKTPPPPPLPTGLNFEAYVFLLRITFFLVTLKVLHFSPGLKNKRNTYVTGYNLAGGGVGGRGFPPPPRIVNKPVKRLFNFSSKIVGRGQALQMP